MTLSDGDAMGRRTVGQISDQPLGQPVLDPGQCAFQRLVTRPPRQVAGIEGSIMDVRDQFGRQKNVVHAGRSFVPEIVEHRLHPLARLIEIAITSSRVA